MPRKKRVVLYDPITEVVYSRAHRKGARYTEDASLQCLLWDKGKAALKRHAMLAYQGYVEAVMP